MEVAYIDIVPIGKEMSLSSQIKRIPSHKLSET